ncbi:MAG: FAD-dependent oxidoreductase [archaeon]
MFEVKVLETLFVTPETKSLRLTKPENYNYVSGQFCLVFLDNVSKPFTFTSSPTSSYLELTVKNIGFFTGKLFQLKLGDKFFISEPKGEALSFVENNKNNLALVAGGSGITPLMSIIRFIKVKNLENKIVLFYSNRTEKDIAFKKELLDFSKTNSNFKVVFLLTREEKPGFEKGYLSKELIFKHLAMPKDFEWFVCGTPKMVSETKQLLSNHEVSTEKIRVEPWQIEGKK